MPLQYGRGTQSAGPLAIPRGPVSGFAQANDLLHAIGICHHPEYLSVAQVDVAIARLQELGLAHVRLGMFSPANHGDTGFQQKSGLMGQRLEAAGLSALWGTTEEPAFEQARGSAVYTVGDTDGTFLRPLDGPSGNVAARRGPSPLDGAANTLLENAGTYYDQGWPSAGGLQGPNEPDNKRTTYWQSLRDVLAALRSAKNARSEVVLGGQDYIDSSTGRLVPGPALSSQLPVVGPHLTSNNWGNLGNLVGIVDCGNRHIYWGGHGPNSTEEAGMWAGTTSYPGLPRFVTESGVQNRPGFDAGPGNERFCPEEVAGVYNNRSILVNYVEHNVRRTYVYKLCDEIPGTAPSGPPWNYGLCFGDGPLTPRAGFYALQNFIALVSGGQGNGNNPGITITGFTPGASRTLADGYVMPDRLVSVVLQTATGYVIPIVRQRELWDRGSQSYINVTDPKTVTINLPAGATAAWVAQPEKNPIKDPVDGQSYPNPGDGQAYAPLPIVNGAAQLTVAGLTNVVKVDMP